MDAGNRRDGSLTRLGILGYPYVVRTPLIAANWKMHVPPAGFDASDGPYRSRNGVDVAVFPTFLHLQACIDAGLAVGAQCGRPEEHGAFTGDVSMGMLKTTGCRYVLCGHSERRKFHGETDADIASQAAAALAAGLQPIVCVGETAEDRQAGRERETVERQLSGLPEGVSVIAYEPVWAIGTGKTPTPEEIQTMHAFIRQRMPKAQRDALRILYGGSLTPENASGILPLPDVDGGLIGGCSLKPKDFAAVIAVAGNR